VTLPAGGRRASFAAYGNDLQRPGQERHLDPQAKVVRVTISSDNAASYALPQYGFAQAGEQWDEDDCVEIAYETAAGQYR
jgi:hypothetical protein